MTVLIDPSFDHFLCDFLIISTIAGFTNPAVRRFERRNQRNCYHQAENDNSGLKILEVPLIFYCGNSIIIIFILNISFHQLGFEFLTINFQNSQEKSCDNRPNNKTHHTKNTETAQR